MSASSRTANIRDDETALAGFSEGAGLLRTMLRSGSYVVFQHIRQEACLNRPTFVHSIKECGGFG